MDKAELERKRAAHYAHFCSLMPELIGRLSWSREQIRAHQTKAFRELLHEMQERSPWHARRIAHLDPESAELDDLRSIPPMTKNDLMENWDEIVTVPGANLREAEEAVRSMQDQFYIWGDNVLFTSGGTGGRPGLFLYDWTGLAENWGGMARGVTAYFASLPISGIRDPRQLRVAAIGAEMSAHGSFVVARVFSDPNGSTHMISGWRSVDDIIPKLNAIQPHFLSTYAGLVPALAAAAKSGALTIAPQVIACGGEHFSDESRRLAQQTWPKTDILWCWGTSEGGGTFPCRNGDGFHVCEDQVIIEPIDADGAPAVPGERSAGIYFTNLYNKAMPIVRYFIDDVFEMDDKPCACGLAYQKVRQVHGRAFEKFRYGSIVVHPVSLQLAILEQPHILEYQIRQTPQGAHLAYRSQGEVDAARLSSKMREALQSYGLKEPEITVENVAFLERTSAGKLKRFVPLTQ